MSNRSICVFVLAAASTFSYAQNNQGNDNSQGNEQGHPVVSPAGKGQVRPHIWMVGAAGSNATPGPGYLGPSTIVATYGISGVGSGQGTTVAIVDAYDAPNAAPDLGVFMAAYSSYFSGFSCGAGWGTFTKVNQNGAAGPLPAGNSGWEDEESLDVQWVRAVAPCANIVLVEANSNNFSDLLTAVSTGASLGSVVSMSWGGGEFLGESSYDTFFTGSGVTFMASSGDTGGVVEYPSASVNVIAVGGTVIGSPETAWSGAGGGCSSQEPAIAPQHGFVPASCTNRAIPDVAMDGGSAVSVYISDQGGWLGFYGTSLSVQLFAGVTALANALHGSGLSGVQASLYADGAGAQSSPQTAPYTTDYRDITAGSAGGFSAGPGWDFITGLGVPVVSALAPALVGGAPSPNFTLSTSGSSSQTVTAGKSASYTVDVNASGGFTGNVTFTVSGLPGGANYTLPSESGGTGSSTLNVTTSSTTPAGNYNLTIKGTSGALSSSTNVTLVVEDFGLSISGSSSQTVTQGAPAVYKVNVTPLDGFNGSVNFTVSGLPAGATAGFSPNPVTGGSGSSTMTVTTTGAQVGGPYTLTITGANSGGPSHSINVTLTVNAVITANFSVSATPASQSVSRGLSAKYTVTVTPSGGFTGKVTLSASGLPSRASASFSPNPATTSSTLTVTTNRKSPTGTVTLTIKGVSGSLNHTTTVQLTLD